MSFDCPTSIGALPSSAAECQNPIQCVGFALTSLMAKQLLSSKGKRISDRGVGKHSVVRFCVANFSTLGDEAFWSEVLNTLVSQHIIEDVNAALPNTQPLYRLVIGNPSTVKVTRRKPKNLKKSSVAPELKVKKFERKLKGIAAKKLKLKKKSKKHR